MTFLRTSDKRGAFDICADMLQVLESELECNKALLALKSNVDSRALSKYLDILLKYELVEQTRGNRRVKVRISDKGRRYLQQYVKMVALLD